MSVDSAQGAEAQTAVDKQGGEPTAVKPPTLFFVEGRSKMRDVVRERFGALGFRMLISGEPARALERFRQQPFDALVIDTATTGEPGLMMFREIMEEATKAKHPCVGLLVLGTGQADWAQRIFARPEIAIMVQPVTLLQVYNKVRELLDARKQAPAKA
jgi:DNA-binding response OmpR family regulator